MRRGFWFAAGAGAGVYAMNRARRLRESFTVEGLRDRGRALALGARMVRDEVAQGSVDKESELREKLGLAPVPAQRALAAPDPNTPPRLVPREPTAFESTPPTRQRGSH